MSDDADDQFTTSRRIGIDEEIPAKIVAEVEREARLYRFLDQWLHELSHHLIPISGEAAGDLVPMRRACDIDPGVQTAPLNNSATGWGAVSLFGRHTRMPRWGDRRPSETEKRILEALQHGHLTAFVAGTAGIIYRLPAEYWQTSYGRRGWHSGEFWAPEFAGRLALDLLGYPIFVSGEGLKALEKRRRSRAPAKRAADLKTWLETKIRTLDPKQTTKREVWEMVPNNLSVGWRTFGRIWRPITEGTDWELPGRKSRQK